MSRSTDERLRKVVLEQATEWFARQRAGDALTAAEQSAFMDWLRQSPLHVQEYLALRQLARDLPAALEGIVAAIDRTSADTVGPPSNVVPLGHRQPAEFGTPRKRLRMDRRMLLALAAALMLALGVYSLVSAPGLRLWPDVITVPHGEQRTVELPDGSVMHLNASSRVTVQFSRAARLIKLEQGQALFEVTEDARRPFRVRAGTTEVLAVGTQFDVYRRSQERTTVTVLQGRVEVMSPEPPSGSADSVRVAANTLPLQVSAGEQVQLDPTKVPHVEPVDARLATAWIHREIAFDHRPLGEIAEEINRYARVPIGIEDASLRELRVSGVLDAYDTDSLLLFLGQYGEVEVGKRAILIRRRAKPPASPQITAEK
jgi:transmembrane sensor